MSIFERNPKKTLLGVIAVTFLLIILVLEIALRFTLPYNIGYYTAIQKEGKYVYPYGTIAVNSKGFPDTEFDMQSPKSRIGYFGDSVIMGIGAGDEFRMGDILERQYPSFDHWTFAMMDNGLHETILLNTIEKYGIDYVVYGFNLNDILPPPNDSSQPVVTENQKADERLLQKMHIFLQKNLDGLRGKSYLYTALRTGAKNLLQQHGYGHTGFKEVELFPQDNKDIVQKTAQRLNKVQETLAQKNIGFCLIIFPYEMQISKQAAKTYYDLGIKWEDGFLEGSAQKLFLRTLNFPAVYDGRNAFSEQAQDTPAGTYFVYNKGDKIDFNHPNRAGHTLLAKGFSESGTCPFLR